MMVRALVLLAVFVSAVSPSLGGSDFQSSKVTAGVIVSGSAFESAKVSSGIVVENGAFSSSKLSSGVVVAGSAFQSAKVSVGIVVQSVPSTGFVVRAPFTHL